MNHKYIALLLCVAFLGATFVRADDDDDGNEFTRALKRIGKAIEKIGQQAHEKGIFTDWIRKQLDLKRKRRDIETYEYEPTFENGPEKRRDIEAYEYEPIFGYGPQ